MVINANKIKCLAAEYEEDEDRIKQVEQFIKDYQDELEERKVHMDKLIQKIKKELQL